MLKEIDLDKIFRIAREKGFRNIEIYAESSIQREISIHGRQTNTHLLHLKGIALRAFKNNLHSHFSTHNISTESLLALLGSNGDMDASSLPPSEEMKGELDDLKIKIVQLNTLLRPFPEERFSKAIDLFYRDTVKHFEVAVHNDAITVGEEEEVETTLSWALEKKGELHSHSLKKNGLKIAHHWNDFDSNITNTILESLKNHTIWPAPRGECPIHWSRTCVAKLCLQFLRAFEGDSFLEENSFLNRIEFPLPFSFIVEEGEEDSPLSFDHEGSKRRPLPIFSDGRPKGLALNRRTAEQLNVPPTGHSRRESYQRPSTIGLWKPSVRGLTVRRDPLGLLETGLSVKDLSIASFNPRNAQCRIELTNLTLIHHGVEGERVEPVVLEGSLIDILKTLKIFGEERKSDGFRIYKDHQSFLTEIETSAAISPCLFIPGSVPLGHYW